MVEQVDSCLDNYTIHARLDIEFPKIFNISVFRRTLSPSEWYSKNKNLVNRPLTVVGELVKPSPCDTCVGVLTILVYEDLRY